MVNLQDELNKRYTESNAKKQSLSARLDEIDKFNSSTAVPQISGARPEGYNPMNSLGALMQMINNRKSASQDVAAEDTNGLNILKTLQDLQPKEEDPLDKVAKLLNIKKLEKELGLSIDMKTGEVTKVKERSEEKESIMNLVDELLGSKTGKITGIPNISSFFPGTEAQYTKNKYEQLKSMLSLENRQKLKGSGAISDFEARVLERAASSLGTNLSDKDFVKELEKLRKDLSGEEKQTVGGFTIEEVK